KILLTNNSNYQPVGLGENETLSYPANNWVANTVSNNGSLSVSGSQLLNSRGEAIQLQGVATHGLQWFPIVDNATIPNLSEYLGVEVVRLAMYIEDFRDDGDYWGGYMAEPEMMMRLTRSAIDDAVNAGMYVIVDWHIHNNPAKFTAEAKDFFARISADYGHLPNIIY